MNMAHINESKQVCDLKMQDFKRLILKREHKFNSKLLILNWKLAYPLSIKNKHLKWRLNDWWSKAKLNVDWVSGEEINQDD